MNGYELWMQFDIYFTKKINNKPLLLLGGINNNYDYV